MKHHPEQRHTEIFLGNVAKPMKEVPPYNALDELIGNPEKFALAMEGIFCEKESSIGWKTQRLGKVAYDTSGNILKHSLPCFVKRTEIQAAMEKANPATAAIFKRMLDDGCVN